MIPCVYCEIKFPGVNSLAAHLLHQHDVPPESARVIAGAFDQHVRRRERPDKFIFK